MTQQEFNNTIDKYIAAHIGIYENAVPSTPMDKGECKVMMKQMFSDFVIPLQKELDSLKKVYNDLAESHAKQVIEIDEMNGKIEDLKTELKNEIECLEQCHDSVEENKKLESELLKAKELLTNILNTYRIGTMHHNKIQKILNERP